MRKRQGNTCLIIGANGFIGSHLVDHLAKDGYRVKALDLYSREPQFLPSDNVEIVKLDLFNLEQLKKTMEGVDYVFHSFSATTPFSSDSDPLSDIEINLDHSVKIFQLCVELNVKKIMFISSGGAVYGTTAEHGVVTELTNPQPVSPYGICKLATEHYLDYFQRKFGIEHIIYRLTNPYGPRQVVRQNQGFIPILIDSIFNQKELVIFGDGTMSRDYIYIGDAVKMIINSFEKPNIYSTYNIGSGNQTDLNTIVAIARKQINKELNIVHKEAPKTFLQKTSISIERYNKEFGKINYKSIEDGLKATLNETK